MGSRDSQKNSASSPSPSKKKQRMASGMQGPMYILPPGLSHDLSGHPAFGRDLGCLFSKPNPSYCFVALVSSFLFGELSTDTWSHPKRASPLFLQRSLGNCANVGYFCSELLAVGDGVVNAGTAFPSNSFQEAPVHAGDVQPCAVTAFDAWASRMHITGHT